MPTVQYERCLESTPGFQRSCWSVGTCQRPNKQTMEEMEERPANIAIPSFAPSQAVSTLLFTIDPEIFLGGLRGPMLEGKPPRRCLGLYPLKIGLQLELLIFAEYPMYSIRDYLHPELHAARRTKILVM